MPDALRHAGASYPIPPATRNAVRLLAAGAFFSSAAIRVCDALLPRLAADFSITTGSAGGAVTVFAVAYGVLQLVFGPMADRFGKAPMITLCVFGCAGAATAATFSTDWSTLLWMRATWGAAAAGVVPLALAWIGDAVRIEQRQQTIALFILGSMGGMMFGQLVGGLFADSAWGWRGAFGSIAAGHLVGGTLLLSRLSVLSRASGPPDRAARPLRQLRAVVESGWARVVLAGCLVEGMFLFGGLTFLPAWLHQRHGIPIAVAAAHAAAFAIGGLGYALSASRVVPALGEVRMVRAGGLLMGVGFLLWLVSPLPWTAGLFALGVGFGMQLFHGTLQTHATQMVPHARGTAVALFAGSLFAGQAIGTWGAGRLVDSVGAWAPLAAGVAVLPLLGLGFSSALRHRRR